ncbi:hypothetical protein OIU79_001403 [Salix purpurea]|uniref:Uncharacterized protein n=1 Tax=Salix purpurea TaxID=77065 RepID=A0A9Q0UPX5_SALPP|nr:hypothetical protein OIU79_001403 [Salix purpurea]KAJ6734136.1 hypothetical protein OIU79_001403 [Salix purpurea]
MQRVTFVSPPPLRSTITFSVVIDHYGQQEKWQICGEHGKRIEMYSPALYASCTAGSKQGCSLFWAAINAADR